MIFQQIFFFFEMLDFIHSFITGNKEIKFFDYLLLMKIHVFVEIKEIETNPKPKTYLLEMNFSCTLDGRVQLDV